ncbi:NCR2 [Auxenochlorella protothecoides x Auxenochlorella symbiontica]
MATLTAVDVSSNGLAAVAALLAVLAGLVFLLYRQKGPVRPAASVAAPPPAANGVKTGSHVEEELPADRVLILYGTQTGTAERFAKSLRFQLEARYGGSGKKFVALDTEGYPAAKHLHHESCVLLLMATYGDGEPTDSAAEFYDWAVEAAESGDDPELLKSVTYGVFGLGNRQYEHFCAVGQRLHGVMADLGATPLLDPGLGDDDDDIDDDFDEWTLALFAALDARGDLGAGAAGGAGGADAIPAFAVETAPAGAAPADADAQRCRQGRGTAAHDPFLASVLEVRELHAALSTRSCVHVELDLAGSGIMYAPGDHVAVFPRNDDAVVAEAARLLGAEPDSCFTLGAAPGGPVPPFTGPITLREALAAHVDLLGLPSKAALSTLAAFAKDKTEAARLARLAAPEGRDEYHAEVVAPRRSLLEVMREHASAQPSLGAFFASVADTLQPRYYSISSSPRARPAALSITCVVVDEELPGGRRHRGVASSYLARLRPGDRLPVFVRRSAFRLPADPATPIVMIGPGTGLAPFRGFLQDRQAVLEARSGSGGASTALGPATLFFGCRQPDQDFIYREELEGWAASGALSVLHTAFSRAGPRKEYVQHHIEAAAEAVWDALQARSGCLYICGDAKGMCHDVQLALAALAGRALGAGEEAGADWLKRLAAEGRFMRDVW